MKDCYKIKACRVETESKEALSAIKSLNKIKQDGTATKNKMKGQYECDKKCVCEKFHWVFPIEIYR